MPLAFLSVDPIIFVAVTNTSYEEYACSPVIVTGDSVTPVTGVFVPGVLSH